MNNQVTSNAIAELTLLLNQLEGKTQHMTGEEFELLGPILEAAAPLLNVLDEVLHEMHNEEEEDWD